MQQKWTAFLHITQSAWAYSNCKANLNLDKIPNEVPAGQTFCTLSLKMMNGKLRKSATFTSHWLLSHKQSTSDLYLMQWIIPKHISVCHCWWCSFSMSLQHSILRSAEDTEPFHTSVSLTQLVPITLRAAATRELYSGSEVDLKTFKQNRLHICSLGRIRICGLCHLNNKLLWAALLLNPSPIPHCSWLPHWLLALTQVGNKPVQRATPAEKETYQKKKSFFLWL